MVNEAVFGRVVLGLESTKQRFLRPENLNSAGGVLGEVQQAAGMSDESCAHQLAHHDGEVGRDGCHAVLEVVE